MSSHGSYACPHCREPLTYPSAPAGGWHRCPRCGRASPAPAAETPGPGVGPARTLRMSARGRRAAVAAGLFLAVAASVYVALDGRTVPASALAIAGLACLATLCRPAPPPERDAQNG